MSLLDAARKIQVAGPYLLEGSHCILCDAVIVGFAHIPATDHAPECPWLSFPKIVVVLEMIEQMLAELGDEPIADAEGNWRGFAHSLTDLCLLCGVSSYGKNPHYAGCEWPRFVALMRGEETTV